LPRHRGASVHTTESYASTFHLLFQFASQRFKVSPSQLKLEQLDASLVRDFLTHLETTRHNTASTRNARLAAIKSFLRFLEYRLPALLDHCHRILAIPSQRVAVSLMTYLSMSEMEAIVNAPEMRTRMGIRDRAMLHGGFATGLRVSELIALPLTALTFHPTPSLRVWGKGRRERALPLWKQAAADVRAWLAMRGEQSAPELFLSASGRGLTRGGFTYVLQKYVAAAMPSCPSLHGKTISPHVMRPTCAMIIFQATKDLRKVSLWVGHAHRQTTEIYLRADPVEKIEALEAVTPPSLRRGQFTVPDKLIALLQGVSL
jgi:site-specific recombinase XerD